MNVFSNYHEIEEVLDSLLKKVMISSLLLGIMPLVTFSLTMGLGFLFAEVGFAVGIIVGIVLYVISFFICVYYHYNYWKYHKLLKETRKDQSREL